MCCPFLLNTQSQQCSFKVNEHSTCDAVLLCSVRTPIGKTVLYPNKIFCYFLIKQSLQKLLKNPGFTESCEEWHTCRTSEGVLGDIYDGCIWKEFLMYNWKPFLSTNYTYGLMMNFDWFKPFKHIEYSVGVIYLYCTEPWFH